MSTSHQSFFSLFLLLAWLFFYNTHHLFLDGFPFHVEPVSIPNEIRVSSIDIVSLHAVREKADDIAIVGILGKAQASTIVHELQEFLWLTLTKLLQRCILLLFLYLSILLRLGFAWQALPWERSHQEIQYNVSNALKVISSGLFVSQMSVQTCISSRTCQILSIFEGNMLTI